MANLNGWLLNYPILLTNSMLIHTKYSFETFDSIYLQQFNRS